jgi:hypothetical protein
VRSDGQVRPRDSEGRTPGVGTRVPAASGGGHAVDDTQQVLKPERLAKVRHVPAARSAGKLAGVGLGIAADEDGAAALRASPLGQHVAAAVGQPEVDNDHVVAMRGKRPLAGGERGHALGAVARRREGFAQDGQQVGMIIDQQDRGQRRLSLSATALERNAEGRREVPIGSTKLPPTYEAPMRAERT